MGRAKGTQYGIGIRSFCRSAGRVATQAELKT
jgi:hypothetical protein